MRSLNVEFSVTYLPTDLSAVFYMLMVFVV